MRQRGSSARRASLAWSSERELRALIDGETLLSQRCATADDAFALAKTWKQRMLEHSWQQVLPRATGRLDHQAQDTEGTEGTERASKTETRGHGAEERLEEM